MKKTVNEIQVLEVLRNALGFFGDETNVIYKSKFVDKDTGFIFTSSTELLDTLHEFGFQGKNLKEAGFELEDWYELLKQQQTTEIPAPEYTEGTTLTPEQIANFEKDVERQRRSEEIRANQKKVTADFEKRNKEIYAEQQKIQDQILKSKAAEPEISKIKPLYIKIEETEKVQFTPEEKATFEEYKKEAIKNPEETVIKLAREIHARADETLKAQGLGKEEADFVVNKTAEKIVTELKTSELPEYVPPMAHIAINNVVYEKVQNIPTTVVSQQTKEILLSSIGVTSKFRFLPDVYLRNVTEVAFGKEVSRTIFGSNYNISVSETPKEGFTRSFNFEIINQEARQIQVQQNQTLETIKGLGQRETKTFLFDQSATYFAKSSLGQKVLSNPKAQVAFYSVFKGAGQTITWTSEGFVGNAILRFAPEYAPILNIATGTRFVTPVMSLSGAAIGTTIAAQTAATATEIAFTGGIMASEAFLGGAGTAAAGAAAGTAVAPIVGTAIGAVAGAVGGKVFSEVLSKIKVWWTNNKDVAGPAIAVSLGFGGLVLGGPAVGGVVLLGGLAATGTLGLFAAGTIGVLGFIGRSIGVAIATPVIVTLLVLPPLVAFIMLVINNSAYVVPPAPPSSQTLGADNPYMLVTKVATPNKVGNPSPKTNVTYTVSIRALKDNLTNVKIVSSACNITTKINSVECPNEDIPDLPEDLSISPVNPYTFTFSVEFDTRHKDSLAFDSITIIADTNTEKGIVTTGSASVCIGDCPTDCVVTSDNAQKWPSNLRSNADTALGTLSGQFQGFMSKVCAKSEEINLCYNPSQISAGYYAWHIHNAQKNNCDVYFNEKGMKSVKDALFLITHELTHHVQNIDGGSLNTYQNSGAWNEISSRGFCTYKDTKGSKTESMAEANGLYASIPSWGSCAANYKGLYPKNYMFAEKFMR